MVIYYRHYISCSLDKLKSRTTSVNPVCSISLLKFSLIIIRKETYICIFKFAIYVIYQSRVEQSKRLHERLRESRLWYRRNDKEKERERERDVRPPDLNVMEDSLSIIEAVYLLRGQKNRKKRKLQLVYVNGAPAVVNRVVHGVEESRSHSSRTRKNCNIGAEVMDKWY